MRQDYFENYMEHAFADHKQVEFKMIEIDKK